jgi:hypothetical protein
MGRQLEAASPQRVVEIRPKLGYLGSISWIKSDLVRLPLQRAGSLLLVGRWCRIDIPPALRRWVGLEAPAVLIDAGEQVWVELSSRQPFKRGPAQGSARGRVGILRVVHVRLVIHPGTVSSTTGPGQTLGWCARQAC